jgi:hypothetical protein
MQLLVLVETLLSQTQQFRHHQQHTYVLQLTLQAHTQFSCMQVQLTLQVELVLATQLQHLVHLQA